MIKFNNKTVKKIYAGDEQVNRLKNDTDTIFQYIKKDGDAPKPYEEQYLTFDIVSGGTINWKCYNNNIAKEISYSMDNGSNWTTITSTTAGVSFNVDAGDKVLFKGNNTNYAAGSGQQNWFSGSTASFNLYGNIMSLISGDSFTSATSSAASFAFTGMFRNTKVISTENLILPATSLGECSYRNMFQGCTSLTTALAEIPATSIGTSGCSAMFSGCISLTTAPVLSATTLGQYCYQSMFENCTSLTVAPELSATTLAGYCYSYMFENCTSLTAAPELPATTLASDCYRAMFAGCTSLTSAPDLPATTLAVRSYALMFNGCTNLNYIKCLATNISANSCTQNWTYGVANSGTFVKAASMNDWTTGNNGIPSGWTVQNDDGSPYIDAGWDSGE